MQNLLFYTYNQLMLSNTPKNIETLIKKLMVENRHRKALEIAQQKYQIRQFKIVQLAPNQIFKMYYSLSTRFYTSYNAGNMQSWYENELRIFIWLLVGYCFLQERCISQLAQQDWQYFSEIFHNRKPQIFEFQGLSILKKQVKFLRWSQQQITLLTSIIKQKKIKNKWNEIAKDLFLKSQKKFFRTAKQCRQYWINHLDPTPRREEWKTTEDYQLVKAVKSVGKKWAKVSKMFQGTRTEHMVKNRFKSLVQAECRKIQAQGSNVLYYEVELIAALEKRLKQSIHMENTLGEVFDNRYKKQGQQKIQTHKQSQNFSAEEPIDQDNEDQINYFQERDLLQLQDQNVAQEDELLKFTKLQSQTMYSMSQIDEDVKLQERKQRFIGQSSCNYFQFQEFDFNDNDGL